MKIYMHLTAAIALACSLSAVVAQTEMTEASPSPSAAPAKNPVPEKDKDKDKGNSGRMRDFMKERIRENLAPEVRQRFDEAREKALQDPKIQALQKNVDNANREFYKAIRDKMLAIDPGLGDLVKSHFANNPPKKDGKKDGKESRKDGEGTPGIARLNEAERQQLMAARAKAKADPTVIEAEKNKEAAATPTERVAATEVFHKAMHDALLKADPTIGPILEKMAQPKASQTPDVAATGEPMMKP